MTDKLQISPWSHCVFRTTQSPRGWRKFQEFLCFTSSSTPLCWTSPARRPSTTSRPSSWESWSARPSNRVSGPWRRSRELARRTEKGVGRRGRGNSPTPTRWAAWRKRRKESRHLRWRRQSRRGRGREADTRNEKWRQEMAQLPQQLLIHKTAGRQTSTFSIHLIYRFTFWYDCRGKKSLLHNILKMPFCSVICFILKNLTGKGMKLFSDNIFMISFIQNQKSRFRYRHIV